MSETIIINKSEYEKQLAKRIRTKEFQKLFRQFKKDKDVYSFTLGLSVLMDKWNIENHKK